MSFDAQLIPRKFSWGSNFSRCSRNFVSTMLYYKAHRMRERERERDVEDKFAPYDSSGLEFLTSACSLSLSLSGVCWPSKKKYDGPRDLINNGRPRERFVSHRGGKL